MVFVPLGMSGAATKKSIVSWVCEGGLRGECQLNWKLLHARRASIVVREVGKGPLEPSRDLGGNAIERRGFEGERGTANEGAGVKEERVESIRCFLGMSVV